MVRVLIASYSVYYDTATKVQFDPVLDRRTGCYVGVAVVPEEQAEAYANRLRFHVLTDEEWAAMNHAPEPIRAPAPNTGDPLQDAAVANPLLVGPPPPPESH